MILATARKVHGEDLQFNRVVFLTGNGMKKSTVKGRVASPLKSTLKALLQFVCVLEVTEVRTSLLCAECKTETRQAWGPRWGPSATHCAKAIAAAVEHIKAQHPMSERSMETHPPTEAEIRLHRCPGYCKPCHRVLHCDLAAGRAAAATAPDEDDPPTARHCIGEGKCPLPGSTRRCRPCRTAHTRRKNAKMRAHLCEQGDNCRNCDNIRVSRYTSLNKRIHGRKICTNKACGVSWSRDDGASLNIYANFLYQRVHGAAAVPQEYRKVSRTQTCACGKCSVPTTTT